MLAGFIFKKVTKAEKNGNFYNHNFNFGSISLGSYIFLCPAHWNNETVKRHELGHTKQSLYLGWLYPLVVGVPSLIWAGCFDWYRKKYRVSYYDFYTEKWADKLAKIERW
jgi:hypothetical protein